jgi:hypothetical protein
MDIIFSPKHFFMLIEFSFLYSYFKLSTDSDNNYSGILCIFTFRLFTQHQGMQMAP